MSIQFFVFRRFFAGVAALGLAVLLAGCKTTGAGTEGAVKKTLDAVILAKKFIPFTVPSDAFAPLTVFRFTNGYENIVIARSDLPGFTNQIGEVAAPEINEMLSTAAELKAFLDKKVTESLDLAFVFSDKRVRKVALKWKNPRILFISEYKAKEITKPLNSNLKASYAPNKNIVVAQVWAADGITLQLFDDKNIAITMDASLTNTASLNASFQRQIAATGTLTVNDKTLYYGYRPFDVRLSAGVSDVEISFYEFDNFDVAMRYVSEQKK